MKFLHIIPTYKPAYIYGGPVFSVSLLCENLAKAGHKVKVLATTANGPAELDVPVGKPVDVDGVEVIYFKRFTKDHTHLSPGLLLELWRDCRRYDTVHIHSWWNIPVMLSVLICWMRGVRPVLSPRGMLSDFSMGGGGMSPRHIFHRTVGKFLLRKTRLHATSDAELAEMAGLGSDSFVLPNFIQLAEGEVRGKENEKTARPFTVIFLSRIHQKKNLEGALEALSRVGFDFRFKVAGAGDTGYLQQLKDLAADKGLSDKVVWTGPLHGDEKFRFYADADLFVLPSFNENFANVVIEVLSTGTPVLVSGEVGLSAYVKEHGLGWVCGTEPADIAGKLEEIFSSNDLRNAIRGKAPDIIRKDFSPIAITRLYVAQYEQINR